MYRLLSVMTLIALAIYTSSCEYNLHEEYVSDIVMTDTIPVEIRLSPYETEYNLGGQKTFSYVALLNDLKLYYVNIFVDTTSVFNGSSQNGDFSLDARDYTDGDHVLSIVVLSSSGSGSLADILGAEGFQHLFQWVLHVDKSAPTPVQLRKVENADGIIRLEWDEYTKANFKCYEVIKRVIRSVNDQPERRLAEIKDPKRTYFYDSTYVGGNCKYFIRVTSPLYKAANSNMVSYTDTSIYLNTQWISQANIRFKWNKCKYDRVFGKYEIYQDNNGIIYETNKLNDTSVILPCGIFGLNSKFELRIRSKAESEYEFMGWNFVSCFAYQAIGEPSFKYDVFLSNQFNDEIIYYRNNRLYKYKTSTNQYLDSVYIPNASNIILSAGNNVILIKSLEKVINPVNLSQIEELDSINIYNTGNLSATGWGIVGRMGYRNNFYVYDFINKNFISEINLEIPYSMNYISEDNKYIFSYSSFEKDPVICYRYENGQTTKLWEDFYRWIKFMPGYPNQFIGVKEKSLEFHKSENNDIISSLSLPHYENFSTIDPVKKYLGFGYNYGLNDDFQIISNITYKPVKEIKIEWGVEINKGILFSNNGYKLDIGL